MFIEAFVFVLGFERKRNRVQVGRGQRERERIPSGGWAVSTEPVVGLYLTHWEIMT